MRHGIWTTLVAAACAWLLATCVYDRIEPIRIKLVTASIQVPAGRLPVAVTDPRAGLLAAPWALIARIRHAGTAPQSFVISVDGRRVCERLVSPDRSTRIDCAAAGKWQHSGGPHEIAIGGSGAWTLEYLELATHHGNTTGLLVSYVVPAGASSFVRPSRLWTGLTFAATAAILLVPPFPTRPHAVRLAARVVAALGVLVLAIAGVAPFGSPYRVIVSANTVAAWIGAVAILRWWPEPYLRRIRVRAQRAASLVAAGLWSRVTAQRAAWLVAAGLFILAVILGARAVGGSDSYGYVSEADLWLHGDLRVPQPLAAEAPWPNADRAFAPLGYRPSPVDHRVIVPTYPPGLPMLFAVAKLVGGQTAMYLVVPFFAALLVLATFGLGRRLGSDVAGLIGACLVATSPVVVGQALVAMTDVPVAAMWAVAFYAALGPVRVRNALGAGLAAALAVLIRPNLLPLAAILGLHYAMQIWIPSVRRRALVSCIAYGMAVLPGIVAVALVNRWLYGSPLTSGYGALGELFAWSRMAVNVRNYGTWMIQSQTPAALIGAATIFVPLRSIWPGIPDRRVFVVMGAFVVTLWATYCAWDVFDSWMFLRFMISSWPFFMIGLGSIVVACMRLPARPARAAAIGALVAVVLFQVRFVHQRDVLHWGSGEDRNVAIARFVRQMTPPNSVVICLHHSGSLRYYGGRMTIYFPWLDERSLDQAVEWLAERGVRTYALIEDWEMVEFRARYSSQQRTPVVDQRPFAIYREPGYARLFDLTGPRDASHTPVVARGAPRFWFAPPPVPLESLSLDTLGR